jgi:magnesium-protoporphyrin O-methyltransferase
VLAQLAARTAASVQFTYAPRTPLLATMHAVGRLFPRGDRAPAIEPVGMRSLARHIAAAPGLEPWTAGRTHRVATGFYISQAQELLAR